MMMMKYLFTIRPLMISPVLTQLPHAGPHKKKNAIGHDFEPGAMPGSRNLTSLFDMNSCCFSDVNMAAENMLHHLYNDHATMTQKISGIHFFYAKDARCNQSSVT